MGAVGRNRTVSRSGGAVTLLGLLAVCGLLVLPGLVVPARGPAPEPRPAPWNLRLGAKPSDQLVRSAGEPGRSLGPHSTVPVPLFHASLGRPTENPPQRSLPGSPPNVGAPSVASGLPQVRALERAPGAVRTVPRPWTDINLTGNATVAVTANASVGNVTLSQNASLFVTGLPGAVTLTVRGEVVLTGHALLFVNGSTLAIEESYDVEWNLQMSGASEFVVDNGSVTTNGYQWGAEYSEDANVTIVSSEVAYPTGWVDTDLVGGARLTLLDSWYSSDVILYDSSTDPSTSNFTAGDSAGFNVWLNFRNGTSANVTLPGLYGWRNWTFPGSQAVTGVGYSVDLIDSYVLVFAVMLWQGANLTVTDSPDFALALNIAYGDVALDGLEEQAYGEFALTTAGFDLALRNATVFTWNIYPFAGSVVIQDSEVGEIQTFGSASATVWNSTLTGHGGYYGDQSTSTLSIFDSTIEAQVVAYSGETSLVNCSVSTAGVSRVLATGSGTLYSQDSVLGPNDSYRVIGGGAIDVAWTVHQNFRATFEEPFGPPTPPGPANGAHASYDWSSNGSLAASGTANDYGNWSVPLVGVVYDSTGIETESYRGTVSWPGAMAVWNLSAPSGVESLTIPLVPILNATDLWGGEPDVPLTGASFYLKFAFAMNATATADAIYFRPPADFAVAWDASDDNATVTFPGGLSPDQFYTLVLRSNATTASGVALGVTEAFNFQTVPAPAAPTVTGTSPSNGSVDVAVLANVTVEFSEPMSANASGSYSIAPDVVGVASVLGTELSWHPSGALAPNTTYTVTVAKNATGTDGASLTQPVTFSFRTVASVVPGIATPGPPPWREYLLILGVVVVVALVLTLAVIRWRGARPPKTPAEPAAESTDGRR
jgi:hypothetical protein